MRRRIAEIMLIAPMVLSGCAESRALGGLMIGEEANAGFATTWQSFAGEPVDATLGYKKSQTLQMPLRFIERENAKEVFSALVVYGGESAQSGLPAYYATGALAEKLAQQNGARLVSEAVIADPGATKIDINQQ